MLNYFDFDNYTAYLEAIRKKYIKEDVSVYVSYEEVMEDIIMLSQLVEIFGNEVVNQEKLSEKLEAYSFKQKIDDLKRDYRKKPKK